MTDEQLQRIHDIEYSCDSREELAERIVGLEDELAMYENDHQIALRTYGSWKRLKAEVPKLMEENVKLRELVRDMHAVISDRNSWWDCMFKDTRRFADRMRELGIEVD